MEKKAKHTWKRTERAMLSSTDIVEVKELIETFRIILGNIHTPET